MWGIDKEVFVGNDALQLKQAFFVEVDQGDAEGVGFCHFLAKAVADATEKVGKGRVGKDDVSDGLGGIVVPAVLEEAIVGAAKYKIDVIQVEGVLLAGEGRGEVLLHGVFDSVKEKEFFEGIKLVGEHRRQGMVLAFPCEGEKVFKVAVFVFCLFEVFCIDNVIGGKDEAAHDAQILGGDVVAIDAVFVV